MKVREKRSRLVLLQIRHKVTGDYMPRSTVERWAEQFGVPCAARRGDLEGLSFQEVFEKVRREEGGEGVVVRLATGGLVKGKTDWWLGRKYHQYRRWQDRQHREEELERRSRKVHRLQVQELRAVVKGLPHDVNPSAVLGAMPGAQKVEAFFVRSSGKRGAVVVSFGQRGAQQEAVAKGSCDVKFGGSVVKCGVVEAYSCRSSSNSWHYIRTWHV